MGLWLKCPGCQGKNPLSLRVCPKCGQSLDNLPQNLRVYVIGPAAEAAPKAAAAPRAAASSAAPEPVKKPAAKAPKKPRKKKS